MLEWLLRSVEDDVVEDDGVAFDLQATFQLTMVVCALDEVCSNGEKLT